MRGAGTSNSRGGFDPARQSSASKGGSQGVQDNVLSHQVAGETLGSYRVLSQWSTTHQGNSVVGLDSTETKQRSSQQQGANDNDNDMEALRSHVRGIKDLRPVSFFARRKQSRVSLTNEERNGEILATAIVPGKEDDDTPHALSRGAFALFDMEDGPVQHKGR